MKALAVLGVLVVGSVSGFFAGQEVLQGRVEKLEKRIESLAEEVKSQGRDVDRLSKEQIPKLEQFGAGLKSSLEQGILAAMPIGAIVSWSGSVESLPQNWAPCDGRTVNGIKTPDLRGRFLRGVDENSVAGIFGGQDFQGPLVISFDSGIVWRTNQFLKDPPKQGDQLIPTWPYDQVPTGDWRRRGIAGLRKADNGMLDMRPAFMSIVFIMRVK